MIGIAGDILEELGIPSPLIPAPFPMLPLPKGIVYGAEGLRPWRVNVLRADNTVEDIGSVWGADKEEAEEAAENMVEVKMAKGELKGVIKAVGVTQEVILGL